ncbi:MULTISPECIES: hypothetical protein [Haloferax]|uniref:Uncharacterized protein n=2 Tax=Haloferax gibbonsii TaxID=35746 RepID=A0A0K1IV23_HALGI|nr:MULTISPECIES: hypothetical protein [Haloferax]AKU08274.1 hypothetical protein ABY42_11230 [Haloferax gibbonsii]ELZ80178.1 hypothetical protein C454_11221 [Haloferax gibbonsii ATCC 33959]QOS12554.1 uncharacterized protein HfgLR_12085 [Haloferax gibbonsii]RDZ52563.1 hypothetical protein C5C07_12350 [Haloferax sp. Atlit-4N]
MSTNATPTYEPTLRTDRDPTTEGETRPNADRTDPASGVARCQRQFESTRTERIHNLVDRENRSMPRMNRESASD